MKRCRKFPNKRRYPTKKEAETIILILSSEGIFDLKIYYCEACKGWHLASNLKK